MKEAIAPGLDPRRGIIPQQPIINVLGLELSQRGVEFLTRITNNLGIAIGIRELWLFIGRSILLLVIIAFGIDLDETDLLAMMAVATGLCAVLSALVSRWAFARMHVAFAAGEQNTAPLSTAG